MGELPLHGVTETVLDPEPEEAERALADGRGDADRLEAAVAAHPTFLGGWAALAELALARDQAVPAYAFARVGYHRGLDRIRRAGWKGQGPVPWSHPENRGFLSSVHALMRAAAAIGELPEAQRCRDFLLQLDPADTLKVRDTTFS